MSSDHYTQIHSMLINILCLFAAVGNEKANNYWEKELPPNADRSVIEKFIRAK